MNIEGLLEYRRTTNGNLILCRFVGKTTIERNDLKIGKYRRRYAVFPDPDVGTPITRSCSMENDQYKRISLSSVSNPRIVVVVVVVVVF